MKKFLWVVGIILVLPPAFVSFALYKALEEDKYPSSYNIWKDPDMRTYYANEQEWRDVLSKATGWERGSIPVSPQELLLGFSFKRIADGKKMRPHLQPEFKWGFRGPWSFQVEFESKIWHWGDFRVENWHLRNYSGIGIKMEKYVSGAEKSVEIIIIEVFKDSPAEKAGLKPGDRILQVNGTSIETADEVVKAVQGGKIGDVVKLRIVSGKSGECAIVEVPIKPIFLSTDRKNPKDDKLRSISPKEAWHQNCPVRFIFTLWEGYNLKGLDTKGKEYAVQCLKIRTAIPQGNFDYDRLRKGRIDGLSKVILQAQNTGLPARIKGVIFGMGYINSKDKKDTIEELTIDLMVTDVEILK